MATTTTNFGWDIPQSTDLVKDGATAIAALGQDIDTAFIDLKGGTTGQVLAKASGTDLDFSWVAQDDSNAIQNAIIDAKGDLITATAADTPARLAVGTNGYVLTADSTASTGIKWAAVASGGLTLISTTTLSGTNTDVTVTSGYKSLYVEIFGITANTTDGYLQVYPNGTGGIAKGIVMKSIGGSNSLDNTSAIGVPNTVTRTSSDNAWVLTIDNPDSSTAHKAFQLWGGYNNGGVLMNNSGAITTNTAVTSLRFTNAGGGTWAGGTVKLYGVN